MCPGYEVRWFFDDVPPVLRDWYREKGFQFTAGKPERSDFYLPLEAAKGLNIKIREGRIEIKQRLKKTGERRFGAGCQGKIEYWEKWPFELKPDDSLIKAITEGRKYDWIKVAKERLGFKYQFQKKKPVIETAFDEEVPEACQVELTRIIIGKKRYYSFALESLSENKHEWQNFVNGAELAFTDLADFQQTNGNTIELVLPLERSMGYGEFLARNK